MATQTETEFLTQKKAIAAKRQLAATYAGRAEGASAGKREHLLSVAAEEQGAAERMQAELTEASASCWWA